MNDKKEEISISENYRDYLPLNILLNVSLAWLGAAHRSKMCLSNDSGECITSS